MRILTREPWYNGRFAEENFVINDECLQKLEGFYFKDWTNQHVFKFVMVRKKLEQLFENDCLTHIYNGVIVIIPKDYTLMNSEFFK